MKEVSKKSDSQSMSAQEVSEYLRISLSTVHHLTRSGKLKSAKIGKAWRYAKEDVNAYLHSAYDGFRKEDETIPLENRRFPRTKCFVQSDMELFYSSMKRWSRDGNIINLSRGGALFQTANPLIQRAELYIGAPVMVKLFIPGRDFPEMEIEGSIVHAGGAEFTQFGVKFDTLIPDVATVLTDLNSR